MHRDMLVMIRSQWFMMSMQQVWNSSSFNSPSTRSNLMLMRLRPFCWSVVDFFSYLIETYQNINLCNDSASKYNFDCKDNLPAKSPQYQHKLFTSDKIHLTQFPSIHSGQLRRPHHHFHIHPKGS